MTPNTVKDKPQISHTTKYVASVEALVLFRSRHVSVLRQSFMVPDSRRTRLLSLMQESHFRVPEERGQAVNDTSVLSSPSLPLRSGEPRPRLSIWRRNTKTHPATIYHHVVASHRFRMRKSSEFGPSKSSVAMRRHEPKPLKAMGTLTPFHSGVIPFLDAAGWLQLP